MQRGSKYQKKATGYAQRIGQMKKEKAISKPINFYEREQENLPHQRAESQIERLGMSHIIESLSPDSKPFGFYSMANRDEHASLNHQRKELQAALLTEPPEAQREHLLRAMEDLWLPVT